MFNEERKINYFEYLKQQEMSETTISRTIAYFEQFYDTESRLDKDLSEMTVEEYAEMLGEVKSSGGMRTLATVHAHIRRYLVWCVENDYKTNLQLCDLSARDILRHEKARMPYFKSPEHLAEYLDQIFPPLTHNSVRNINRASMCLYYMGFTPEEAVLIKRSNINFNERTICFNGKKYPIYEPFAYALMHLYHQQTVFVDTFHPFTSDIRRDGDRLLASHTGAAQTGTIRVSIRRALNEWGGEASTSLLFTTKSLITSGLLYEVYLTEKKEGQANFDAFVTRLYSDTEKSRKNNSKNVMSFYLRSIYDQWKAVYDIGAENIQKGDSARKEGRKK